MNQRISFERVIKGLRVNLGEIKDDTPVAGWAEAAEMITNQNFLRIIAPAVVWVLLGVNHNPDSSKTYTQNSCLLYV